MSCVFSDQLPMSFKLIGPGLEAFKTCPDRMPVFRPTTAIVRTSTVFVHRTVSIYLWRHSCGSFRELIFRF